jgi:hypothetical protein
VAFARRAPLAAAATLAAAAAVNELFFGHLARCGAALPAVFFVAYLAGRSRTGRARTLVVAGVLVSVVLQCLYDPRLGAPVIILMAAVSGVFTGAGVGVRRRAALVTELRRRTGQLQELREQAAALAVTAERARITADISDILREGIDEIGRLAGPASARDSAEADPPFAAIELAGRAILDSLRQAVGTLRDTPVEPEPGLAELAGLLARASTAATRLSVEGPARPLPASIELTGYRIVEQLTVLRDEPSAEVDVSVRFAADCLELSVAGPPADGLELRQLRPAVQARLAMFGGSIDIDDSAGRRAARVRLPLVTSHA